MINPRMTNMTGYIIDCPHAYMSILHYHDKIHQEINSYQSGDECLSSQHAESRSGQISVNSKPGWSTLLVPDQQGYTMKSYLSNKPDHKEKSGIWLLSFNLVHQEGSVHHRDNIPSALAANKQKTDKKGLESNVLFMTYLQEPNVLLLGSSSSQEKQAFQNTGLWAEQSRSKQQQ